ncbi:putative gamma-glutamyl cyclotransferase [Helianthus anomalus]
MASVNSVNANGGNIRSVFVYGSLLADDVVRALLRRVPQNSPAILHGYHRFSVKGRVYPAILPVENKKITGRVCSSTVCFCHLNIIIIIIILSSLILDHMVYMKSVM